MYSMEPTDKAAFTKRFDKVFTRFAALYVWFIKLCPFYRNWIKSALQHIQGPRVLEVSFGTGYLLQQYVDNYEETHGVEYNERLLDIAKRNLKTSNANLVWGTVEDLPYRDAYFDSIVVTMAFTGYPDGHRAMSELKRVLKVDGKLIVVDVNYPQNKNWLGALFTRIFQWAGDIIRDMDFLFAEYGFEYSDEEVGGSGSIHLYVATKKNTRPVESLTRM